MKLPDVASVTTIDPTSAGASGRAAKKSYSNCMTTNSCTRSAPSRRKVRWPKYDNDDASASTHSLLEEWHDVAPTSRVEQLPPPALCVPLISNSALAARLGTSTDTLARERRDGRLVGHRIRGQWRYTQQQFDDYLALTTPPLRLHGQGWDLNSGPEVRR